VAANKDQAGGIRLCHGPNDNGCLAYRYELTCRDGSLWVKIFDLPLCGETLVFEGPLADAKEWAEHK
jgi:hypothetical protein